MNQPPTTDIPKKTSTLAILSLVFACSSILTPLFIGTIGGIVFGHLAFRSFRRNPQLEGRSIAKWGLIIAYASLVILPLLAYFISRSLSDFDRE